MVDQPDSDESDAEIHDEELRESLKPSPPAKLAPRGIRTFTVARQIDESGVSGTGVVIEGMLLGTGQFYERFYKSSY